MEQRIGWKPAAPDQDYEVSVSYEGPSVTTEAKGTEDTDEFSRFEGLAVNLVHVPKTELGEKLADR